MGITANSHRSHCDPGSGALSAVLLVLLFLAGCATPGEAPVPVDRRADTRLVPAPATAADDQHPTLVTVLAAEMAAAGGRQQLAAQRYARAAAAIKAPAVLARGAELAMAAGDPAASQTLVQRWVAVAPESGPANRLAGLLAVRAGKAERAFEAFRRSLPSRSADREAAMGRIGGLLLDQQLPPAALDVAQRLADAYPQSDAARLGLARVALAQGQPRRALATVEQTLAARGDWLPARLLRLDALLALGRDEAALAAYRSLFDAGIEDPGFLLRAAAFAMEAGDRDLVLSSLNRLQKQSPALRRRGLLLEGEYLRRQGQMQRSIAVLDRAVADYPRDTDLRYARAITRISMDRLADAEADLRFIIRQNPEDARALNALGYTLVDETDRIEEGRALIEKAFALAPDDPAIIDSMGWAAFRAGQPEQALPYLRRAHERTEGDAEIAAHLGEVLWVLGQRDKARAVWQDAIERQPDHPVLTETIQRLDD
ncbi:UNVERIFIED_CONTAM: tetratricopeptide repeat protein [Spiribacter pallidus]